MKIIRIVLTLVISVLAVNLNAQDDKKVSLENAPVISFERSVHDYGTVNEGDVVETTFKFTNTGNIPLVITRIKSTCGCTVPKDWKKTPIQPGEKSQFSVKFNTRNKPKKQSKRVTILSNAKGSNFVTIKANVIPDPVMQQAREERMKKYREKRAAEKLAKSKDQSLKSVVSVKESDKAIANKDSDLKKKELKKQKQLTKDSKEVKSAIKKNEKEVNKVKKETGKIEKDLKKAKKERKRKEKEVRKKEKEVKKATKKEAKMKALKDKILTKKNEIAKDESKLAKLQLKLDRKIEDGELSPNDIAKKERIIEKKQAKIDKLDKKLKKLERKL